MTRQMLNAFFLPEDQDAFARSQGWQDAEQMCYYENMSSRTEDEFDAIQRHKESYMTDSEVEEFVEREESISQTQGTVEYLAPPPSEILVLARVSCEEAYTDDEACPLAAWYDTSAELEGVY